MAIDVGNLIEKLETETMPEYIERIYQIFKTDFIESKPNFYKRVGLKRYPLREGKEATFWHFTRKGEKENDREIDITRCQRIRYPKIIIENFQDSDIKCWKNKRGIDTNILLFSEKESYLVVLSDRGEYVLPWTAYPIEYKNRKEKLLKEYEEYIKKNADDAIYR